MSPTGPAKITLLPQTHFGERRLFKFRRGNRNNSSLLNLKRRLSPKWVWARGTILAGPVGDTLATPALAHPADLLRTAGPPNPSGSECGRIPEASLVYIRTIHAGTCTNKRNTDTQRIFITAGGSVDEDP